MELLHWTGPDKRQGPVSVTEGRKERRAREGRQEQASDLVRSER